VTPPQSLEPTSRHVFPNTFKSHAKHVYGKLGATGRESAVERARALHILR
jgi:ATP/maltotriose-dependent transcriptional regulator MalT